MHDFNTLLEKYLNGSITPKEWDVLQQKMQQEDSQKMLNESIDADLREIGEDTTNADGTRFRIFERLEAEINKAEMEELVPRRKLFYTMSSKVLLAASLILLAVVSVWMFMMLDSSSQIKKDTPVTKHAVVIKPGSDKATLTLADGSQVILGEENDGNIVQQNGITIVQLETGKLAYQGKAISDEVTYNTITTPRGGQYQVVLPDGSIVRLNASSSLRFPTVFVGGVREVFLTGQGFFEVVASKTNPFVVKTAGVDVSAMGTSFDVMAYPEESELNTTLVEGVVKVNESETVVVLKPGQQAKQRSGDKLLVKEVNVEEIVAWTKGTFHFSGTPVENIMRQIQRWYDVEVEYGGDFSSVNLSGVISRKKNMTDLLEALEATGDVAFKLEGRKILVLPGAGE